MEAAVARVACRAIGRLHGEEAGPGDRQVKWIARLLDRTSGQIELREADFRTKGDGAHRSTLIVHGVLHQVERVTDFVGQAILFVARRRRIGDVVGNNAQAERGSRQSSRGGVDASNHQWSVVSGQWSVVSGQWSVVSGDAESAAPSNDVSCAGADTSRESRQSRYRHPNAPPGHVRRTTSP